MPGGPGILMTNVYVEIHTSRYFVTQVSPQHLYFYKTNTHEATTIHNKNISFGAFWTIEMPVPAPPHTPTKLDLVTFVYRRNII